LYIQVIRVKPLRGPSGQAFVLLASPDHAHRLIFAMQKNIQALFHRGSILHSYDVQTNEDKAAVTSTGGIQ
jgi:hypothetical protein